jgi:hypothetical protein
MRAIFSMKEDRTMSANQPVDDEEAERSRQMAEAYDDLTLNVYQLIQQDFKDAEERKRREAAAAVIEQSRSKDQ